MFWILTKRSIVIPSKARTTESTVSLGKKGRSSPHRISCGRREGSDFGAKALRGGYDLIAGCVGGDTNLDEQFPRKRWEGLCGTKRVPQ